MVLDVMIDKESLTIDIANPFHPDIDALVSQVEHFGRSKGADISQLNLKVLIPLMIKGVVGCEKGCPADAKKIVTRGFEGFELQYIEGGILSAYALLHDGRRLTFKMFPDF